MVVGRSEAASGEGAGVSGDVDVEAWWEGGVVLEGGCEEGQESQLEEEGRFEGALLDGAGVEAGCCCSEGFGLSSSKRARNLATSGSTVLAGVVSLGAGGGCAWGGEVGGFDSLEVQNQPMMSVALDV